MLADVHILFESDNYRITDFKCHCDICSVSKPEYNTSLCISFIRRGFFEYRTFKRNDEVYVGRILISKPGFEHTARHIEGQPDITTVFEFKNNFFEHIRSAYPKDTSWFLLNDDMHSILLSCNAVCELLHRQIFHLVLTGKCDRLQVDELVMELLGNVLHTLGNTQSLASLSDNHKQYYLPVIEKAKEYILQHFNENISLQQLSQYCCVSVFHLSRIFKNILGTSPHQYLLHIRLQQAKFLLKNSLLPVNDISFECGFNSLEHFATAFRQVFGTSPSMHRQQVV